MNFPKVNRALAITLAVSVGVLIPSAVYAFVHGQSVVGFARLVLAGLGTETLHGIQVRR